MKKRTTHHLLNQPAGAAKQAQINLSGAETIATSSPNDPSTASTSFKHGNDKTVNLVVDNVPYMVNARPFTFNGEKRFYININGGADHVFTWDPEVGRLRAIDDNAGGLPDTLESAISSKLLKIE